MSLLSYPICNSSACAFQLHPGQFLHGLRHVSLRGQLREPAVRPGAQAAVLQQTPAAERR